MNSKSIFLAALIGLSSITFSCSEDEPLPELASSSKTLNTTNFESFIKDVEDNFHSDQSFVESFVGKYDAGTLTQEDYNYMLILLQSSLVEDVTNLDNQCTSLGIYDAIEDRLQDSDFPSYAPAGSSGGSLDCDRLLAIRNAMLEECDNYFWGVDEYCRMAVMIAWWIQSEDCV